MSTTEADFRTSILPFTLHEEGGFGKDPHDLGNWSGGKVGVGFLEGTKYGIAASAHPTLDIAKLSMAQAAAIYWRDYVQAQHFDRLALPMLMVVFDAGVNCGPGRAALWLREVEKAKGVQAQIAAFTAANLAYHRSLKTWRRYGKGWGARIEACQKRALLLAAAHPVVLAAPHSLPRPTSPRPTPKAATQPPVGLFVQILRAIVAGLLAPSPKGSIT